VLIVEDNEHAGYLLRILLERAGYGVGVSPDGRDALAKLASMDPVDVVILDLMLPYVSGYQVLIEARQNPKWQRVPIVVVTARTLEMDAVRALETGANDFVREPFLPEELIARVRRAIDLQRDLALLYAAALLEKFRYRQLTVWWRLKGLFRWAIGRRHKWETITRSASVGTS
jgi:DNA-binding response OmpR family regulator